MGKGYAICFFQHAPRHPCQKGPESKIAVPEANISFLQGISTSSHPSFPNWYQPEKTVAPTFRHAKCNIQKGGFSKRKRKFHSRQKKLGKDPRFAGTKMCRQGGSLRFVLEHEDVDNVSLMPALCIQRVVLVKELAKIADSNACVRWKL